MANYQFSDYIVNSVHICRLDVYVFVFVFVCKKNEKQGQKSLDLYLDQIKLPYVLLKSNFPHLVLTAMPAITSQFLHTKPFPAPGFVCPFLSSGSIGYPSSDRITREFHEHSLLLFLLDMFLFASV